MNWELTYTLKQQTPLIHFQHKQAGATLRATEVKPKLDKFLLKNFQEQIDDSWKLSDNKTALNYKLRLVAVGEQETVALGPNTDYDIFYGNMGVEKETCKEGVIGDVKMTIVCTIPLLRRLIDENIAAFFIVTNFGTMQNKGFGSYIVEEKKDKISPDFISQWLKKVSGSKNCYSFPAGSKPFKSIKTVYSIMKSGYNFRGDYHRSYLFEYCHEKLETGNEKAAMKKEHISPYDIYDGKSEPVRNPDNKRASWDQSNHPYMYVRALLGVGEGIEYIAGFKWGQNKKGQMCWMIDNQKGQKGKEKIEIHCDSIERCASPVRFKIIGNMIYMFANRIDNKIYEKIFTFTNKVTKESTTLSTPKTFDIDDFLEWFVEKYNNDSKQMKANRQPVSYGIGATIIKR